MKTHSIEFVVVILLTVSVCLSNLSKDKKGEFTIPAVCVLVAFMLPSFVGQIAGSSIGRAQIETGRSREGVEYGSLDTRNVSGAERWNRAQFFENGIWLFPVLTVGLLWAILSTRRVQAKLTSMEDRIGYSTSGSDERLTDLEKFRYGWASFAILLLIFLSTGLMKP